MHCHTCPSTKILGDLLSGHSLTIVMETKMKKVLKGIGFTLLGLVVIVVIALAVFYGIGKKRLNAAIPVPSETVSIPTDAATISGGEHLTSVHCAACHGTRMEGGIFLDMPPLGSITAPAIAGGQGKYGTLLSDVELVRAIRHGVGIDAKPLAVMPSGSFYHFNDQDLGQIIAYLQSLPTTAEPPPPSKLTAIGIALFGLNAFGDILNGETIDHAAARPAPIEADVTVEYGRYKSLVGECRICHGPQLSGGKDPTPGGPFAPNLTPGGNLGVWSEDDFMQTMRTGVTPEGKQLLDAMPWKFYGKMNDVELKAIYLYLRSLDKLATTN